MPSFITTATLTLLGLFAAHASAQGTPPAHMWLLHQADVDHYPFVIHLPDRTTRSLPPLSGPPPLLLSLSGSGARGNASEASVLAGYDGSSRRVRFYNSGVTTTLENQLAAEEFLMVVPIAPIESAQADAAWDITVLPAMLASVAALYPVDLNRVYFTSYSMGSRAAWSLAMQYPDIFAGMVISSGSTAASPTQLKSLLGIPIRNYYGTDDEAGLSNRSIVTQQNYLEAMQGEPASVIQNATLETIVVDGADHLTMTDRPWQEDVLVDGYEGALAWLIQQRRSTPAVLPAVNGSSLAVPTGQNSSTLSTSSMSMTTATSSRSIATQAVSTTVSTTLSATPALVTKAGGAVLLSSHTSFLMFLLSLPALLTINF